MSGRQNPADHPTEEDTAASPLSCPPWCVEHWGPDPTDEGNEGTHNGPKLSVDVEDPGRLGAWKQMTVQLNAHDRRGHRTTVIHLVCLDSEITELRRAEAHAFAEMLTGAADLLYAPAPSGCPSWCVQHEVDDEDEHTFYHDGPTTAISVRDPLLLGVPITTQVVALESHGTVAMSIQLRIKDGYAKLNAFQARATAAHMLDCAGLLED